MPRWPRRRLPKHRCGSLAAPVRRELWADVIPAGGRTLRVPHVEAPHVKLDSQTSRRTDPFHDKLRFGDNFLAGVTRLAVASAAPEARDTVLRSAPVSKCVT